MVALFHTWVAIQRRIVSLEAADLQPAIVAMVDAHVAVEVQELQFDGIVQPIAAQAIQYFAENIGSAVAPRLARPAYSWSAYTFTLSKWTTTPGSSKLPAARPTLPTSKALSVTSVRWVPLA